MNQVNADIQSEMANLASYDKQYELDINTMFDKVIRTIEDLRLEQHQNRQQRFKDDKNKLMSKLKTNEKYHRRYVFIVCSDILWYFVHDL